jgi:hypothetical protein
VSKLDNYERLGSDGVEIQPVGPTVKVGLGLQLNLHQLAAARPFVSACHCACKKDDSPARRSLGKPGILDMANIQTKSRRTEVCTHVEDFDILAWQRNCQANN